MLSLALASTFPELELREPLRVIDEGFRSVVIETGCGKIFRIGKNASSLEGYSKESRLLPLLQAKLPLPIPNPLWFGAPSSQFPFGVIGYPKLKGIFLTLEMASSPLSIPIARDLASFLLSLHRFPLPELEPVNLPRNNPET